MRIVITTDCFLPRWDGIARFLSEVVPHLAKSAQVVVFAPRFHGVAPLFKGVLVERFPLMNVRFGDIFFCRPDKRLMRRAIANADVVFNQTIGPVGSAGISIARKLGKPVVSYVHSLEWELAFSAVKYFKSAIRAIVRWWARRMYNSCALLLVSSKELDDALSSSGIKVRKEVVELGVDTSKFVPPRSKVVAKKNLGLSGKVVGFCGRIAREKDLPTLFSAVDRLVSHPTLLIVGEGLENELPRSKHVIRVGRQDDVVPFLQAMDVFVLPSLTETSSLATMEAMSCGVPALATPVGSIPHYLSDGVNGFLFARQDVSSLSEKLAFLLSNASERSKLGRSARKSIVESYDIKHSLRMIDDFLRRVS